MAIEAPTLSAPVEIENLATAMRDAGMPIDQAERFIQAGYIPLKAKDGGHGMLAFHADAREADNKGGPEWIALGGKRGPGKSHAVMAQVGIDDCQRVPELKWLFLRKIQKAAKESLSDVIRRVFTFTPYSANADGVYFDNGSRIVIGGYKDEKDIDKYLGIEYDGIVVEECTQIIENKINALRGSLRTSKPNWRPRIYLTTNADGPGLAWFKRRFVQPARDKTQKETRFHDVTNVINPFINEEYETWLQSLTGALAKAWRDGDWDAFAGMAFPEWNRDLHVVRSFEIPNHWMKWRATDWGNAAPWCTLWFTKDPDTRRVYVYREAYQAGLTDKAQARRILDLTQPGEVISVHYADPALWEKKNRKDEVYTTADEYKDEGVVLTKATNDRVAGKRKVNNILAIMPDGLPGVQIFENCVHLIDQMGSLPSDKNNPEDVDTDSEDHAYDTFRYGLTNEKRMEQKGPPKIVFNNPLRGTGL